MESLTTDFTDWDWGWLLGKRRSGGFLRRSLSAEESDVVKEPGGEGQLVRAEGDPDGEGQEAGGSTWSIYSHRERRGHRR
jgi:hypothetical protein